MSNSQREEFDLSPLRHLKSEIFKIIHHHRSQLDGSFQNYRSGLAGSSDGTAIVSDTEYRIVEAKYNDLNKSLVNILNNTRLLYEKAIAVAVEIRFMMKELDNLSADVHYDEKDLRKYVDHYNARIDKYEGYGRKLNKTKSNLKVLFKTDGQGRNRLDLYIEELTIYSGESDTSWVAQNSLPERKREDSLVVNDQTKEQLLSETRMDVIVPPPIEFEDAREEATAPAPKKRQRLSLIRMELNNTTPSIRIEESCQLKVARSIPRENIVLLPNGLSSPLYRVGDDSIKISNTCGFDSIAQIFLAALVDDPCYEAKVKLSRDKTTDFLVKLRRKTDLSQAVEFRDSYLVYLGTSELKKSRSGVLVLNLFGSLSRVWDTYYSSIFVGHYHFDCSCPSKTTKPKHFFSILYQGIDDKDPRKREIKRSNYISDRLNELMRTDKAKCPSCRSKNFRLELEDQLYIEILNINNSNCTLELFQDSLTFLGKKFRLAGVVDHQPAHFIAYVRRIDGSWQIYDDMEKNVSEIIDSDFNISPGAVIYVRE